MITSEKVVQVLRTAITRMADRHKVSSDHVAIRICLSTDDIVCYQVRVNNAGKEYVSLDQLIGGNAWNIFIKGHFKKQIRILAAEHSNASPYEVSILVMNKDDQIIVWLYVGSHPKTKLSIEKLL